MHKWQQHTHTHTNILYTFKVLMQSGARTLDFPSISAFPLPTVVGTSTCKFTLTDTHYASIIRDTHMHSTVTDTRTYTSNTHTRIRSHTRCWYFSPAVGVWCTERDAHTQKCQHSRELGKEGLINGEPLSTAMPLHAALWLHIALLPNEAQLLDEYNGFALELQGIMAQNLPPLSASLCPSPADSGFCVLTTQGSCSFFWFASCPLSCAVCWMLRRVNADKIGCLTQILAQSWWTNGDVIGLSSQSNMRQLSCFGLVNLSSVQVKAVDISWFQLFLEPPYLKNHGPCFVVCFLC